MGEGELSWVKVDDKAWSHPKFSELTGNSVKLWLFAMCWCNQHETDGAVSRAGLRTLGGSKKSADELVAAGLWLTTESGWMVHDFLKYQPSHEQREKDREEARQRAAKSYRRNENSAGEEIRRASEPLRDVCNPPVPVPVPVPVPGEEKEISSITQPVATARKHTDAFTSSFKPPSAKRTDVLAVHGVWQRSTGRNDKFVHTYDDDADSIAKAIDVYGLADTLLVAKHCREDRMVNGLDDEGKKHESMRYIFGNNSAFGRILKLAKKRESERTAETAEELMARKRREVPTPK